MPGDPLRLLAIGDGRSLHTIRWAQRLAERGHELHLVTNRVGARADEVAGVTVHDLRRLELLTSVPGIRRLRFGRAIRNLASELDVDVVHAHGILPYGWWAARADVHPLVVSPGGRHVLVDAKKEPGRSRARLAFGAADHLVVNSRAILDAAVEAGADPTHVLHTIWHTRLEGFGPENAERDRLRAELGWPADSLIVLSLRNFQHRTNIDVLVRAFDRVRREEPSARLLLAARAGETKHEIEALVDRLGLGELVRFHRVEPQGLPPLVASADVTVTIADTDSTPSSLLEAMASGQPIIGGWCPSIDEWIGPGEGAEMVSPKDEEAVFQALLRLLRDPALRESYGRRNAEVARSRVVDSAPALESLYRELVGRGSLRSGQAQEELSVLE
jgi:L-malate glycosyltransferase